MFAAHDRLTGQAVALKRVRLFQDSRGSAPAVNGAAKRELGTADTMALATPSSTGTAIAETLTAPEQTPEYLSLRLHLAQEFRTLAGLRHPHIVSVLDYGFDESRSPYFTMELLDNASPLDKAARNQPMETRLGFLMQILQALAYLHRRRVLHRDLKPGTIPSVENWL